MNVVPSSTSVPSVVGEEPVVVPIRSETEPVDLPPTRRRRATSLGEYTDSSTQKLLVNLIGTLDASFPDYDFQETKPEQFIVQDLQSVANKVNTCLDELSKVEGESRLLADLWDSIDAVVDLSKCEIFSYTPDANDDPFSDGALWSFNYFFFSKQKQKICYLTCVATR